MKKTTLHPSSTCALNEQIGANKVIAFNVGPSGEVCLVIALKPLDYQTESNGFARFPKVTPASPQRYRILMVRAGELELDLIIDQEPLNIHNIQPLSENILLACSRSEYRGPGDFDHNARVYGRDGTFLRDFLLGDGIETIQATRHGEIWASYFDEGVFGNLGWHEPVGASGLVAWSSTGEKSYEYEPEGSAEYISDCYALNVATDEDVWCYYYTDFPLVHLHKKRITSIWHIPVNGSSAFAIENGHALFSGSYNDRDTFQLVRLNAQGNATRIGQFQLLDGQGDVVEAERVVGRGGTLYILSKGALHEISLDELVAKRRR